MGDYRTRKILSDLQREHDFVFKILLIGDSSVGKSALIQRFADYAFTEKYTSTIGVDFRVRTIKVNGKSIKLQIWDTSGQERFKAITVNYYRNVHGIMVVFDVTQKSSFTSIENWLDEIRLNADESVTKLLLGNKTDLEEDRVVTSDMGMEFASHLGMSYVETSAKDCVNVEEAFVAITTEIMEHVNILTGNGPQSNVTVSLQQKRGKTKLCC